MLVRILPTSWSAETSPVHPSGAVTFVHMNAFGLTFPSSIASNVLANALVAWTTLGVMIDPLSFVFTLHSVWLGLEEEELHGVTDVTAVCVWRFNPIGSEEVRRWATSFQGYRVEAGQAQVEQADFRRVV